MGHFKDRQLLQHFHCDLRTNLDVNIIDYCTANCGCVLCKIINFMLW